MESFHESDELLLANQINNQNKIITRTLLFFFILVIILGIIFGILYLGNF